MTKEEMKAYAIQAGIPSGRVDEAIKFVQDGWDDGKTKKYFDSIAATHKASQLNPTTDYTDATLKQRMAQDMAGKSEEQLKKEADDIASVIVNGHV